MKKVIFVLLAILTTGLLSGCAALFRSEGEYNRGTWNWITGSDEVEKMKQKKLDFKKLEALPLKAAKINEKGEVVPVVILPQKEAAAGLEGTVANLNRYDRANIVIMGPEIRSFLLGPGQVLEKEYLLPGDYTATTYIGNTRQGQPWRFTVGVRQFNYMGKIVHWYVYYE